MTRTSTGVHDHEWILSQAERIKALGETERRFARDPVSQPVINAWLDAIGDTDPRWTEGQAPPAMAQVWTMPGLRGTRGADDPLSQAMEVLDAAGFTSVLGTNCDQTYERYLRVGEQVSVTTRLEDVAGPKQTGVGEGYFVTTRNVWRVGEEVVATMQFRVLKFKPRRASVPEEPGDEESRVPEEPRDEASRGADRSKIIRPVRNADTDFFWEGTQAGELRIQRCNACGVLRHPPGPVCPECHAMDRGYVVASGRGTIFSFLVHHAPQMPGRDLPVTIALVELAEGVRFVADVRGNPEDLAIGDEVVVGWDRVDDDLTLPIWEVVR
ncbi:MAG: OB-fold domain-containing protein [Marmoricola sp.]|nr:OB-fold domain-containing protein [Marmoricola sp.]